MKVIKIILILITIFLNAMLIKFWYKKSTSPENILKIGTAAGYAPFVSINNQGKLEGFDVDIAKAIATNLNKKYELIDLGSMSALFLALEQDRIDMIIWALSITQDRLQKVAMIRYSGQNVDQYPLIFWKQIPKNISSINDMDNKIVSVEVASSQEKVLDRYSTIKKLAINNVDDALLNIMYQKSDAALIEPAIAQKFKNKYPEIQIMPVTLPVQDQVQGIGIAIKKNNKVLIEQIQNAINQLQQEQVIEKLEQKWNITV